ncbi:MAG: DMT family transporter [Candidatus Izemoplasma sp.]|nr:DMT family transporter [Candidatus Izemoplasma sp.]
MADKKVLFAEVSLFFVTIIWGLGFPITRIAFDLGFGANTIMVGRFLTAAIVLAVVYRKKLRQIDSKLLVYGSIAGVFLFLGFFFQTLGNAYTTPSKNGFITQLNIVFVPYLYFLFFKKKVDVYNGFSIILAVFGLFLLSYEQGSFDNFNIGDFYTLICAIMVAFHVVTGSYFQKTHDFDPALFVLINIAISAIFSILAAAIFDTLPPVSLIMYWPLIFLGIFNTALGFLVQSYALKLSLPTKVSLIVALESVFAAIGSVFIVDEILSIELVLGGLLIIGAVLFSELKPFRRRFIKIT